MDDEGDAYIAFQEGSRLLADGNAHAAVDRARAGPRARAREGLGARDARPRLLPLGSFRRGRAEFRATLELEPVNDYAHFGLGLCRLRAGDRAGPRATCGSRP